MGTEARNLDVLPVEPEVVGCREPEAISYDGAAGAESRIPGSRREVPSGVASILRGALEPDRSRSGANGRVSGRQDVESPGRGVLNDYIRLATYHMPEESRLLASLRLSETPQGPLEGESADQRTCDAFGLPRRRDWWWSKLRAGPHVS